LTGYIVYWGTESKNYENKVDVGLKNRYILDSMKNNGNYYFSVKAYDSKDLYNMNEFFDKPVTIKTQYNLSEFSEEVHLFRE